MRILHFLSELKKPKTGPGEYVVVADDENEHDAHLIREWSRPGFLIESITKIDDLPGMFPANRLLLPGEV